METLFSLLGLYQLLGVLLPGAVGTAAIYFAVNGMPPDPSTAGVLGLIVLFYVVGNVIQGAAVVWESRYWKRFGGWPSTRRMSPTDSKAYDPAFRTLIQKKLDALVGSPTDDLSVADRFGLARAELRRLKLDERAEGFNAIYGLSRGLVTAGAVTLVTLLGAAIVGHASERNLITAAIVGVAVAPVFNRFQRFGWYFADQVWRDFVAVAP
jgi:hypothetical protein